MTLFEHGAPATVAATDEDVLPLDKAHYSLDDGPYLEATRTETVLRTDSEQARMRWPAFADAAAAAGIKTSLSCPLFVRADDVTGQEGPGCHGRHLSGALNVWSRQAGTFEPLAR